MITFMICCDSVLMFTSGGSCTAEFCMNIWMACWTCCGVGDLFVARRLSAIWSAIPPIAKRQFRPTHSLALFFMYIGSEAKVGSLSRLDVSVLCAIIPIGGPTCQA